MNDLFPRPSRRQFIDLGIGALAGIALSGCGRANKVQAHETQLPKILAPANATLEILRLPPSLGTATKTVVTDALHLLIVVRLGHGDKALEKTLGHEFSDLISRSRKEAWNAMSFVTSELGRLGRLPPFILSDGATEKKVANVNRALEFLKVFDADKSGIYKHRSASELVESLQSEYPTASPSRRAAIGFLLNNVQERFERFDKLLKRNVELRKWYSDSIEHTPAIRLAYEKGLTLKATEDEGLMEESDRLAREEASVYGADAKCNDLREDYILSRVLGGPVVQLLFMGADHRFADNALKTRVSLLEINPPSLPNDLKELHRLMRSKIAPFTG